MSQRFPFALCTLALAGALLSLSCASTVPPAPAAAPPAPPPPSGSQASVPREAWVDTILARLSVEEKVGQMLMVGMPGHFVSTASDQFWRVSRLVREGRVGGIILWRGDVYESAVQLNTLQALARVPLLVSADFERGMAMRIRRSTPFPDAMAIGATRNPHLAYAVGYATAQEARAIGVHQNYAPVGDVNTNALNPVINTRAFADDLALVNDMASAYIRGTQDGGVIATVKHFPGHGETGVDSHLDLPIITLNRARIDSLELAPFRAAISAGVQSVMIAHLAVPAIDPSRSVPASLSPGVIAGLLQREMGFSGLVVTDAMDMRGVTRDYAPGISTVLAVKAGVDIVLMPPNEDAAYTALLNAVRKGELTEQRLDVSVRKILQAKWRLGLDTLRTVDPAAIGRRVGTPEHWLLARDVARRAMTLVKNDQNILPLQPGNRRQVLSVVLSDTEDNRVDVNRPTNINTSEAPGNYFHQLLQRRNGRVETVRLHPGTSETDIDAALARVRRADQVLLQVYVKVRTSSGRIDVPGNLRVFLDRAQQLGVPTIAILFGSPYIAASLPWAKAILCAYGDSEPLVEASVEALYGEIHVCGRLPVTVNAQFPAGSGATCPQDRLLCEDPRAAGFVPERLDTVRTILERAIADGAFPAAQIAVVRNGILAYQAAFGTSTYDPSTRPVDGTSIFDLASVSKVAGTTLAVMKLFDLGILRLDDSVSRYLPQFAVGPKRAITIRHLLTHRAGFPPFRRFFLMCSTAAEALDSVYATELVAVPGDTTIYSDIGMISLAKVVEAITDMSQAEYLRREFYEPLGMKSTMYNPPPDLVDRVVPTEIDTLWRRALVHGQVHDENAALLGGVAGHAGLFSTASDLAVLVQMLLNRGTYGGRRYLQESTVVEFTRQYVPGQERYLGWDMKSPVGSSAGSYFSPSSFGHLGFTGTSIWVDPERKLGVILLTNRVHPTRANLKIAKVRPAVHDAVVRAIVQE